MKENKTLFIKVFVPVLILAVIVGMWFVKNQLDISEKAESEQLSQENPELPEKLQSADFSLNITEVVDFEELAEYEIPVIVDYGADSCIPCKQMAPVLERLNKEMYGKAFIKFGDVWKYPEAVSNVPVQVIPTQLFFNADGTPFEPSDKLHEEVVFDYYSHVETGEHIFTVHQGGLTEEQMRMILAEMGVE